MLGTRSCNVCPLELDVAISPQDDHDEDSEGDNDEDDDDDENDDDLDDDDDDEGMSDEDSEVFSDEGSEDAEVRSPASHDMASCTIIAKLQ